MEKIKILIVAGTMDCGGVENQLMHLVRNADKNKFQIDFTSTKENGFYRSEIEQLGSKYILIPTMDWKKPWIYYSALIRVMKDGQYDIVHSNELFHSGIIAWIAHLAKIKKCFVHSHSSSDARGVSDKRSISRKIYNSIMRSLIIKYSDVQIACSSIAGEFLFGKKAVKKKSYHVIFNSIDCNKYIEKFEVEESGEFCDDWINIIHIGRVYAVKNQMFITEIVEEFKKRNIKTRFLCAGDAFDEEYMNDIKQVIKEKELQEYMLMLGNRSDVDVLLRKSSVFILPSLYEGMPLALIEAQAAGLYCVVADTFSREVDFEIGTVKWMDSTAGSKEWANTIEEVLKRNKPMKQDIIEAIQKKKFDSRLFSAEICKLYTEAIERS